MKTIFSFALLGTLLLANKSFANTISTNSVANSNSFISKGTFVTTGDWCNGVYLLTANFGSQDGTWRWLKDGVVIEGATSNSVSLIDLGLGNYTVSYQSKNGENFTDSFDFTALPGPKSHFVFLNIPPIGATRFADSSKSGDAPIVGWHWDFGDGTSSTEQNPEHFYKGQKTYTVILTTTDSNGCSNSVTILVEWKY